MLTDCLNPDDVILFSFIDFKSEISRTFDFRFANLFTPAYSISSKIRIPRVGTIHVVAFVFFSESDGFFFPGGYSYFG